MPNNNELNTNIEVKERESYVPVFKGYERFGQFPLEKNSKFKSKAEADKYAKLGLIKASSAFPGQIISVEENDKIMVFTINPQYELVGITSTTTTDSTTYLEFGPEALNSQSGIIEIVLEKGSFLKSITVQILEEFTRSNPVKSIYFSELNKPISDDCSFIVAGPINTVGGYSRIYIGEEDLLTNEIGDYTVYFNELLDEELTRIKIFARNNNYLTGRAILKIN